MLPGLPGLLKLHLPLHHGVLPAGGAGRGGAGRGRRTGGAQQLGTQVLAQGEVLPVCAEGLLACCKQEVAVLQLLLAGGVLEFSRQRLLLKEGQ